MSSETVAAGLREHWENAYSTKAASEVGWFKPALKTAKFYSNGFTVITSASGSAYAPTNIPAILTSSNAAVVLAGAELDVSVTNPFTINSRNPGQLNAPADPTSSQVVTPLRAATGSGSIPQKVT